LCSPSNSGAHLHRVGIIFRAKIGVQKGTAQLHDCGSSLYKLRIRFRNFRQQHHEQLDTWHEQTRSILVVGCKITGELFENVSKDQNATIQEGAIEKLKGAQKQVKTIKQRTASC
jgi:hypothetical protein